MLFKFLILKNRRNMSGLLGNYINKAQDYLYVRCVNEITDPTAKKIATVLVVAADVALQVISYPVQTIESVARVALNLLGSAYYNGKAVLKTCFQTEWAESPNTYTVANAMQEAKHAAWNGILSILLWSNQAVFFAAYGIFSILHLLTIAAEGAKSIHHSIKNPIVPNSPNVQLLQLPQTV